MISSKGYESVDDIAAVLESVQKRGIRLWSENGQLRYRAIKGTLTNEEIEILRLCRDQVVARLNDPRGGSIAEYRQENCPKLNRAPLSFSQLAHWHLYQLSERHATRHTASATRMRGNINIDELRRSMAEVVRRHEALRTRIVSLNGVLIQEIAISGACEIRVDDLTEIAEHLREVEVKARIEQFILEPIDVTVGPLFGVRLLKLRDDEHVLIVAMEHLISDGFSLNILMRDLLTTYDQALRDREFCLPPIPVQFADYAIGQRNACETRLAKHGAYWNARLMGCQRLRFPEDHGLRNDGGSTRGSVPIRIGRNVRTELSEWSRARKTTLVLSVFTAYVGLVLRWCNASESVFQYQFNCRDATVEHTIGYFSSVLYLRVSLLPGDTFVDLLNRITEEYCQAYEHADFSYMAAQVPRPEFTRNTAFNWLPEASLNVDLSDADRSDDGVICSPVTFTYPWPRDLDIDREPFVLLSDLDSEIVGDVYFQKSKFCAKTMERFSRVFLVFIRALLERPEKSVWDVLLV